MLVASSVDIMWQQKHGKSEVKKVDTENRWFKCEMDWTVLSVSDTILLWMLVCSEVTV